MELSFVDFNILEGSFWIVCTFLCVVGYTYFRALPSAFWYVLGALFVLFAASDYIEAYFQLYFLTSEGQWLLVWKILCLAGFALCLCWYIKVRFKK